MNLVTVPEQEIDSCQPLITKHTNSGKLQDYKNSVANIFSIVLKQKKHADHPFSKHS